MRIVIVPDSFKESASAVEVAEIMAQGCRRAVPGADIVLIPIADGGEGTVDAIVQATGGQFCETWVTGPLGEPVLAKYGLIDREQTAIIELASAAGLTLVPPKKRDPRITTTRGVGELIVAAAKKGIKKIIVGIGGSATNDGGAGMAQALGYRLLDSEGNELPPGGAALLRLARIDESAVQSFCRGLDIRVACDVTNPLCGERGASKVYAPQKGASEEVAEELDHALSHFASVIKRDLGIEVKDVPGAGAAGGMGAGLLAFGRARLMPGFALISEACNLKAHIETADLVLTGEGSIDAQTLYGKVVHGVVGFAASYRVPVLAFAGRLGDGYQTMYQHGLTAAFAIADGPITFQESVARLPDLLANAVCAAVRTWAAGAGEKW